MFWNNNKIKWMKKKKKWVAKKKLNKFNETCAENQPKLVFELRHLNDLAAHSQKPK